MIPIRHFVLLVFLFLVFASLLIISYVKLSEIDSEVGQNDEFRQCQYGCFLAVADRCLRCNPKPRHFQKRDATETKCESKGLVNNCKPGQESECERFVPMVMGHAGGHPSVCCENTIQAFKSGIAAGMDAVHIDISVSKDSVPFLWRDHDPRSLTGRLRQMGSWGVGACRPALAPGTLAPAHLLTWSQIQSSWFYVLSKDGLPADSHIVSFQDWLSGVADNMDRLKKIWIEFRVPRNLLQATVQRVWDLAVLAGARDRLFFNILATGEIIFPRGLILIGGVETRLEQLSYSQQQMEGLHHFLDQVNQSYTADNNGVLILNREDEAVFALLREKFKSISSPVVKDLRTNVKQSSINLKGINFIVKAMDALEVNAKTVIELRNSANGNKCSSNFTEVAVWTVNDVKVAEQLVCDRADIIITDYPERVRKDLGCNNPKNNDNQKENSFSQECPQICTRIYSPVCGSDGKTYSNECMMRFQSCENNVTITQKHEGKCGREAVNSGTGENPLPATGGTAHNGPDSARKENEYDPRNAVSYRSGAGITTTAAPTEPNPPSSQLPLQSTSTTSRTQLPQQATSSTPSSQLPQQATSSTSSSQLPQQATASTSSSQLPQQATASTSSSQLPQQATSSTPSSQLPQQATSSTSSASSSQLPQQTTASTSSSQSPQQSTSRTQLPQQITKSTTGVTMAYPNSMPSQSSTAGTATHQPLSSIPGQSSTITATTEQPVSFEYIRRMGESESEAENGGVEHGGEQMNTADDLISDLGSDPNAGAYGDVEVEGVAQPLPGPAPSGNTPGNTWAHMEEELSCETYFCLGSQAYAPVCGEDGVTYDNECSLRQTKCSGPGVKLSFYGPCKTNPCENTCSSALLPVCGTDKNNYINTCTLLRMACYDQNPTLGPWHRGWCGSCSITCPRSFEPVCGSDGVTYSSSCSREFDTCKANTPVREVSKGECGLHSHSGTSAVGTRNQPSSASAGTRNQPSGTRNQPSIDSFQEIYERAKNPPKLSQAYTFEVLR